MDEETVRRRLKRAERLGALPGWRMMANPHLIGYEAASMQLEVRDESRKAEAISELKRIDAQRRKKKPQRRLRIGWRVCKDC